MKTKKQKKPKSDSVWSGERTRQLTRYEQWYIARYRLHPKVEERVITSWKAYKEPRVAPYKKEPKGMIGWLSNIVMYLLPFMLWIAYLDPGYVRLQQWIGHHAEQIAQLIITIGVIMSWMFVVVDMIVFIGYIHMTRYIRQDPWNPRFLNTWKRNSLWRTVISMVFMALICSGLIVNGWYLLCGCLLISYLLRVWGAYIVRRIVKIYMYPYAK